MDLRPCLRASVSEPVRLKDGRIQQLISCMRKVLDKAGLKPSALLGVGVADPGLVDSRRGITIMSSMIEFWKDIPLGKIFEEEFGVPPECLFHGNSVLPRFHLGVAPLCFDRYGKCPLVHLLGVCRDCGRH